MRYQAALFDLDGTLLDTLDDLADCTNGVLSDFAMPTHPVDSYRYFVGNGWEKLAFRAAPAGTPEATLKEIAGAMAERYAAGWAVKTRIYDGVADLLGSFAGRGLKLAVLSNKPDVFTQVVVRHFFGDSLFALVIGARPGVPPKPDPSGALEIASRLDIASGRFLYLGDTNTDMQTGLAAGMYAVGVAWGFRPVVELREAGAKAIIEQPLDAVALLG